MVSLNNLDEQIGALEEDEEEEPEDNVWDESHTMCLFHDACVLNWIVRRQPSRHIQIIQQILDSSEVMMCPPEEDPVSLAEINSPRLEDERGSKSKRMRKEKDQGEDIAREEAPKKKRKDGPWRTVTDRDGPDEIILPVTEL